MSALPWMSPLSWFSIGLWMLAAAVGLFSSASVKINGRPLRNPLARMAACFLIVPVVGLAFLILGFIGLLLAAPIVELINPSWLPSFKF